MRVIDEMTITRKSPASSKTSFCESSIESTRPVHQKHLQHNLIWLQLFVCEIDSQIGRPCHHYFAMSSESPEPQVTVTTNPEPIFLDISPDAKPIELESLCMACMQNGKTTMLLTRIPFFREVMISRFECEHCGYTDNRVQFAGEFPAKGVHFELKVTSPEDLCRRVVKSCFGVIRIPEINFEIPGPTQADSISTVEGVIDQAVKGLRTVEQTPQLQEFLDDLTQCQKGLVQFTFILDDPSGNSFIENPQAPKKDPNMVVDFYKRSKEQMESIGLVPDPKSSNIELDTKSEEHIDSVFSQDTSVMTFPTVCPVCSQEGQMRSCTLNIPHFKEIVLMAFNCENCSYHNGEVMVGGAVSPLARKITCKVQGSKDLERELLKSETASIKIPECELDMQPGTLGGKFTTVEGILQDIKQNLTDNNPFVEGDSAPERNVLFEKLISSLDSYLAGAPCTIIMDDPLANSYIQEYEADDDHIVIEDYERTEEQNEMLGINDMKTEAYDTGHGTEYVKPALPGQPHK